jgi:hypothetical protein
MFKSLTIVDDVYDDPEKMRDAALRLDYPVPVPDANYAGRNSSRLSWVAGEQLFGATERAHGALRLTLAGDTGRYCVHVDIGVDWSGVLYLNHPEQCRGGTSFFRHRSTGSEHAPTTAADLVRCNARTAQRGP